MLSQRDVNAAMQPWSDAEIVRFSRRVPMFERRGLSNAEAAVIADRLALRDQQKDDRRMCIECDRLQQDGGCFAVNQGWITGVGRFYRPVQRVLQRCIHFKWAIPS